jgi:flagellar biosynthesis chaperone FliJ
MPQHRKYPLQSLMEIRRQAVDKAKRQLASAIRKTEDKTNELKQREAALREANERIRRSAEDLGKPDESGLLSARQLAGRQSHLDRLRAEAEKKHTAYAESRKNLENARKAEDRARAHLRKTHQDLKLLSNHQDRWKESVATEIRKAEEETSEEAAQVAFWHQREDPDGTPDPGGS